MTHQVQAVDGFVVGTLRGFDRKGFKPGTQIQVLKGKMRELGNVGPSEFCGECTITGVGPAVYENLQPVILVRYSMDDKYAKELTPDSVVRLPQEQAVAL